MNRQRTEIAQLCSCVLLAGGAISLSATGCEPMLMLLIALVLAYVTLVVGAVLVVLRRYVDHPFGAVLIAAVVCLAVILSVGFTDWPLRVSYALHRRAFDSIAERVRAGEEWTTPRRIGLFKIRRAEVYYNGVTCLWTDLAPAGYTGFAQCRGDDVPFNLWSIVRLDDDWQFISED